MFEPREGRDESRFRVGRGALFPLALIVLLAFLASETLLRDRESDKELEYVDVKALVRDSPREIQLLRFRPRSNGLELRLANGQTARSHYPTDESAFALETLLDRQGIRYDAASRGDSAWWSFLTYLLPFVLFVGS
jgi:ATP-dependent Zn protease